MTKKDDLKAQAEELGINLQGGETSAELEALIDLSAPEIEPPGKLTRSKINRGSRRRIERAINKLNVDMDKAIKEFDLQAFVADDDGKRVAEWSAVTRLREAKADLNDQVNKLLAG